jgi:hypothetical protein
MLLISAEKNFTKSWQWRNVTGIMTSIASLVLILTALYKMPVTMNVFHRFIKE